LSAATQSLLDSIAYVAWHGHKIVDEGVGWVKVTQPGRDDLLNYVGAAHAGAIFTLAETAGGVAADGIARPLGAFILLRGAEVKYTRRASGALVAGAHTTGQARDETARRFALDARADIAVDVVVDDADGQRVFESRFQYALRPRTS
jgi:acyl-coenzyme A thioesterase PaaI-like protein